MRISVKLASLALAASLLLTGCGVSITGVTLGLPATMERGSTGQATPEYAYSGATPEQAQADELAGKLGLAYASSDPAVVMVDADGNLAAVGAGGSADTASDPNASASVSLEYGALPFSLAAQTHTWRYIDSTDSAYWAVLNNMNAYRAAAGVAPLSVDANLSAIADQRTADMIVAGYIRHEGYQTSEIVAQNYPSAQDVVYGWATSPDHYAAMTNPNFTICGIGCSFEESGGAYWCVTLQ